MRALAIAPDHPAANNNLGSLELAQGNSAAARDCFAAVLEHDPSHLGARLNLAASHLQLDDLAAALQVLAVALAQAPQLADAHFLHGLCLQAAGRHGEAIDAYAQAEGLAAADARFPYQRGLALEECKRHEEASVAFAVALAREPNAIPALAQLVFLRRRLCDWQDLAALSARLLSAVRSGQLGATAFSFLSEPATASDQLQCARTQARVVLAKVASQPALLRPPVPAHDLLAPIRAGFLSNGFGAHPTGLLTVALFEALRSQAGLETHLFALNPDDGSPMRQRLQNAAVHWHDAAGRSPDSIAQRIADAGIDILFDLRGWGGGGMPEILARRPAPLQVNWLAYPGTSGAPWIDYILADRFVVPERLAACFSEAVAW
ncbi:MAG: tetratricopeptide repeat protein, partial [Gammaproteobacteria bacterium]|nr:tetratricopeptide repeat protein [Gammaproteobacteria bacterium]